jgi:hypothetical protein
VKYIDWRRSAKRAETSGFDKFGQDILTPAVVLLEAAFKLLNFQTLPVG